MGGFGGAFEKAKEKKVGAGFGASKSTRFDARPNGTEVTPGPAAYQANGRKSMTDRGHAPFASSMAGAHSGACGPRRSEATPGPGAYVGSTGSQAYSSFQPTKSRPGSAAFGSTSVQRPQSASRSSPGPGDYNPARKGSLAHSNPGISMRSRARKDGEAQQEQPRADQRPRSMAPPPPPSVPTVSEATVSAEETLGRGSEQPPPIGAYDWSALASGGGDGEGAHEGHEGQAGGELTAGGGELDALSIRDLKEVITSAGLSTDGCLDRQDLLQRAREAMASAHQTREQNQEPKGEEQHKLQDQEPFNPLAWLFSA